MRRRALPCLLARAWAAQVQVRARAQAQAPAAAAAKAKAKKGKKAKGTRQRGSLSLTFIVGRGDEGDEGNGSALLRAGRARRRQTRQQACVRARVRACVCERVVSILLGSADRGCGVCGGEYAAGVDEGESCADDCLAARQSGAGSVRSGTERGAVAKSLRNEREA